MRVVFETAESWMKEIDAEAKNVLGGVVRMRTQREPEQAEEITWQVGIWLTAVIVNENGPNLVEFGGVVGSDDASGENGTAAAREIAMQMESLCDGHGLELRDGKIEAV